MAVGGTYLIIFRWKMFGFIPRKACFINPEWKTWAEAYHAASMLSDLGNVEIKEVV